MLKKQYRKSNQFWKKKKFLRLAYEKSVKREYLQKINFFITDKIC